MLLVLLSTVALAGGRPPASDTWVLVPDDVRLCTHPGGQGQCARFLQPGAAPAQGQGPRVMRVVAAQGDEIEVQAQFAPNYKACGVMPARITSLRLRLYVPASALQVQSPLDACYDPDAAKQPGPGRDPERRAARVATVAAGAWVTWPDGTLAGQAERELWLQEEHGLYQEGGRWCATFDLGPDDGGPVTGRALDVCFAERDIQLR